MQIARVLRDATKVHLLLQFLWDLSKDEQSFGCPPEGMKPYVSARSVLMGLSVL